MKPILSQKIIDKYILDEFGKIPNPPTKNKIIELINNDNLTLRKVKLWALFGGDLNIKGTYGRTILHSASWMEKLDIIQYVLDKGVSIDILNDNNLTPLMYASQYGQIEVINYLLNRGANINHQTNIGWSALHYASNWNQLEAVKVLVEKGIDIQLKGSYCNKNGTALDIAKYIKRQKIVDYLTPFYQ